ncbi:DUF3024 domain-containing protein [Kribbella speibonae]|uniref:DUF3024 domain-containing protein n=2 Tax=Kribbella speibonae TaxID=1572660 RepID=A0A4R0ITK4_9ACTN|nr:DUF3024 domain-containing protein [Kribbella speibonae]
MALPDLDVARVQHWCAARVPEHARDHWTSSAMPRLRYNATDMSWTLYWADQHQRFHTYNRISPSQRIEDLLTEIERDPTNIFWG